MWCRSRPPRWVQSRNVVGWRSCASFGVGVHIGGVAEPALVCMAQTHLALTMPGIQPECEVGEFQAVSRDPTSPSVTIRDGRLEVGEDAGFGVVLARVAAVVQV